ncbi:MAG: hypothetical protein SFY32_06955 [Bacteroidota bacterium]|nr:hypothetical protein [Bacteroidota bacterium]
MAKSILLISPFPPNQNPRLLKEYHTLKQLGYSVKVIYGERDKWAAHNFAINDDFILVGGKINSIVFLFTRILHKAVFLLKIKEFESNRVSIPLYLKAKSIKADLYIGHNLPALPIAVNAAKYHKAKCGFDAEDFHRFGNTNNENSRDFLLAKYLEDKYLPLVDYLSAASPLIAQEYQKLYPFLIPVVINNVFPLSIKVEQIQEKKIKNQRLDLFWFSQTVGKNRGLEDVVIALSRLLDLNITLHILGNANEEIKNYLKSFTRKAQIYFHDPIPPDDIFTFASQFDIGLALEQNIPFNRDICLTNKIFTYLSSGLAIIATETQAQLQFFKTHSQVGKTYPIGNIQILSEIIMYYYSNLEGLKKAKQASITLANNELNWEKEKYKLIELVNKILING